MEKPLYNVTHNDADEQAEMFRAAECGEELERVAVNQSKKSAEPIMGNKARALQNRDGRLAARLPMP